MIYNLGFLQQNIFELDKIALIADDQTGESKEFGEIFRDMTRLYCQKFKCNE